MPATSGRWSGCHDLALVGRAAPGFWPPVNPGIEALRGLAALMVLAHHYSYLLDATLTRGTLHFLHSGVDLFFVITGYLFAPYLLGQARESAAAFTIRRVFRLLPLYVLSLAVAVLKDLGGRDGLALAAVKHLLFIQALPLFSLAEVGYFTQIYWTLPVEVMFYGLVLLAMLAAPARMLPAQGACDAVHRTAWFGAAAALAYLLVFLPGHDPSRESWVLWQAQLPALLPHFWFGLLVFVASPTIKQWPCGVRRLLWGAGLLALVVAFLLYADAARGALTARPFGPFNLLTGLAFAMVLAAVVAGGWAGGLHTRTWALRVGALSYGVYLFHEWTLKVVVRLLPTAPPGWQVVLALAMVLALAWFLHRTVEAPLREFGRTWALRHSRPERRGRDPA